MRRSVPTPFVLAEIALVLLVPLLAFGGVRGLLSSTDGVVVEQLEPTEPGYRAPVDLSVFSAVALVDSGKIGGVLLIAQPDPVSDGGGLIVVPPTMISDEFRLDARQPDEVGLALGVELRLNISDTYVVDSSDWQKILSDQSLTINNPDPIPDGSDGVLVEVGNVEIDSRTASAFVARASQPTSPTAITVRQRLFWDALNQSPPDALAFDSEGETELGNLVDSLVRVANGPNAVVVLPHRVDEEGNVFVEPDEAERLISRFSPFPSASPVADRVLIKVLTRSISVDPIEVAAEVAALGVEITEIGNAEFDEGPTQILAPETLRGADPRLVADLEAISEHFQAEIEWVDGLDDDMVVSLIVGPGQEA